MKGWNEGGTQTLIDDHHRRFRASLACSLLVQMPQPFDYGPGWLHLIVFACCPSQAPPVMRAIKSSLRFLAAYYLELHVAGMHRNLQNGACREAVIMGSHAEWRAIWMLLPMVNLKGE